MLKKTKIVCTIGPASDSVETLKTLMQSGMNVCRLNFSHGSHEEHLQRIKNIKQAREELDMPIAIMLDTKGPEIRLGDFGVDQVQLSIGDQFTLTTRDVTGDQNICSVSYKGLPDDLDIGKKVLIDDGLVELEVVEIKDTDVICKVNNYGILKSKKGVNIPNSKVKLPAITEKDISDIKFGIENGIDYIAASFIRKSQDVLDIRKILEENKGNDIKIISKIESQEGVDNLDEIINTSDGIMVARGDLGVEIQTEIMPIVQKEIIKKTSLAGKPVITATQMLDSMIRNPRPTRAEVTDVANAILDGSDAVMLSGETAAGNYPVNAVKVMNDIAINTENSEEFKEAANKRLKWLDITTTNAISIATRSISEQLGANAIVVATTSGSTARNVSKYRPLSPIVAATTSEGVMRKLSLIWGVHPVLSELSENTDEVIDRSISAGIKKDLVHEGDLIIITAGLPVGVSGTTNLLKVHTIGDILIEGTGIGKKSVTAKARVAKGVEDLASKFEDGNAIVLYSLEREFVPYIQKASAIIVEEGGLTSPAAIVGLHLGIPTIVGCEDAVSKIKDQEILTIDPIAGLVYRGAAKIL